MWPNSFRWTQLLCVFKEINSHTECQKPSVSGVIKNKSGVSRVSIVYTYLHSKKKHGKSGTVGFHGVPKMGHLIALNVPTLLLRAHFYHANRTLMMS